MEQVKGKTVLLGGFFFALASLTAPPKIVIIS
jgi:hypothetical protein